jgi:hypothetical protein
MARLRLDLRDRARCEVTGLPRLRASKSRPVGERADHVGCERRQIEHRRTEEKGAEASFPLRATTTAADPSRDCASSGFRRTSVGPSKYELQGPTV